MTPGEHKPIYIYVCHIMQREHIFAIFTQLLALAWGWQWGHNTKISKRRPKPGQMPFVSQNWTKAQTNEGGVQSHDFLNVVLLDSNWAVLGRTYNPTVFTEHNYKSVALLSFSVIFRVSTLITPGWDTFASTIYASFPTARRLACLCNCVTIPSRNSAGSTRPPTQSW